MKLWDAADGHVLGAIEKASENGGFSTFPERRRNLAFSPDGRRLAWSNLGVQPVDIPPRLSVFDLQTGQEVWTIPGLVVEVRSLAFGPDGRRLVAGLADGSISLYDAADGHELLTLHGRGSGGGQGDITWLSFSPDGHRLASFSSGEGLNLWDGTPLPGR